MGNGDVPDNYALYDDGIFEEEGGTLSPANGKTAVHRVLRRLPRREGPGQRPRRQRRA